MPDNWLKTLGMGGANPLRNDWGNERDGLFHRALTFRKRPASLTPGDGIVLYAAGIGLAFAVGRVTSFPYLDEKDKTDWSWRIDIELDYWREFVRDGVRLDALSVAGRDLGKSIRQKPYIRLRPDEFDAAVEALRR